MHNSDIVSYLQSGPNLIIFDNIKLFLKVFSARVIFPKGFAIYIIVIDKLVSTEQMFCRPSAYQINSWDFCKPYASVN